MSEQDNPSSNLLCDLLLLGVLSSAVLFPALGQNWNWASREARFAEIIREMAESGDYLVPTLLGVPDTHKPPVMQAAAAAMTRLVGESSMTLARLPSALAGLLGVFATYGLGRVLFERRTALFGAITLLGIAGYTIMARQARPDMVLCAAILFSCLGLGMGMQAQRLNLRTVCFVLAGFAAGVGVVTKGVYGLLFPVLFLVLAPIRRSDLSRPRAGWIALGLGTIAAISLWVVPVYLRDQGVYLQAVIHQAGADSAGDSAKPFYVYLWQGAMMTLPLCVFLPLAVRDWRRHGYSAPLAIAGVILVIISCIPKKRVHYLLPMYPFLALAIGATIVRHWETGRWVRRATWALVPLALAAVPIYSTLVLPYLQPNGDPQMIFAKQILAATDPKEQIYCIRGNEAVLAWVGGRHDRIHELREDSPSFDQTLNSIQAGSYLVIPTKRLSRVIERLGPLSLEPVLDCRLMDEKMSLLRFVHSAPPLL